MDLYLYAHGEYTTYKIKKSIKDMKKLISVAWNYCGDLFYQLEDNSIKYIIESDSFDEENLQEYNKELKQYGIEFKLVDNKYYELFDIETNENLMNKYGSIKACSLGREIR